MAAGIGAATAVLGLGQSVMEPASAGASGGCGAGYYENSSGQCIPDPEQLPSGSGVPAGATAICRDGDYSFSTHRTGTCSGHGGVSQWLSG